MKAPVGFRMRQCESISVPQSTSFSWRLTVKSSPEKPRYIIVSFQTDKHSNQEKNPSVFNHVNVKNMYVTLNSSYLCNLITHRNSRPGLRSSSDASILHIPRSNTSSGDNAFMVFAPKLWNALPLPIRQAPSLETFKKVLKTHLFVS